MNTFNIPLIPNRVSWILIASFNKYSISFFWGTSLVGIFTAANRIPSLITVLYGIIQQALLLVVIEEYEDDNNSELFNNTYSVLGTILLISVIIINILIKPMAPLLFSHDFYEAYMIAPIMVLSSLFGSLHGNLTTIFTATKKTSILFQNSVIGMVLTIVLSIVLVPRLGVYGAVMTSLIVYFIMWFRLLKITKKTIQFNYPIRVDLICYIVVLIQWVVLVSFNGMIYYILSFITLVIIVYFQRIKLLTLISLFRNKIQDVIKFIKFRSV